MSKPPHPRSGHPLDDRIPTVVNGADHHDGFPFRITIVGAGYVGLVTAACFADQGHVVTLLDVDEGKIAALGQGQVPIFEPGLTELLDRNRQAGRIRFATQPSASIAHAQFVFLAVGTPCIESGEADTSAIFEAVRAVAPWLAARTLLVTKSTVPAGTGEALRRLLRGLRPELDVSVASNPEFLRQGSAVADFMAPDRIVFGCHDQRGEAMLMRLYAPARAKGTPVVSTTLENAELAKYASNAFLAMKIAFINEVSNLCEAVGGDVRDVAAAIGLDQRIGPHCLATGPGFGGSCFPKDTRALASTGRRHGAAQRLVEAVIEANERRKHEMSRRILAGLGSPSGKCVAILGAAFKAGTDDTRESPAAVIVPDLERAGVAVRIADPKARSLPPGISTGAQWHTSALAAASGADAAVILTEWPEFGELDLGALAQAMRGRLLFDMRNLISAEAAARHGLRYVGLGVPASANARSHRRGGDAHRQLEPNGRRMHRPLHEGSSNGDGELGAGEIRLFETGPDEPANQHAALRRRTRLLRQSTRSLSKIVSTVRRGLNSQP